MCFTFKWTKDNEELNIRQGLVSSCQIDDAARRTGGAFADSQNDVDQTLGQQNFNDNDNDLPDFDDEATPEIPPGMMFGDVSAIGPN